MKEEKQADKGGKKSKAQKTKATLVASRNATTTADVNAYDEDFGEYVIINDTKDEFVTNSCTAMILCERFGFMRPYLRSSQ